MWDAIIIGGSTAGLSAALVLGRARRRVLVIDSGKPCNRFSHASHGLFTRDGTPPPELLGIARDQLAAYTSVEYQTGEVVSASAAEQGFDVTLRDGTQYQSRKLLLAYGLTDHLPEIDGMQPLWGTSVFHCPYCDGWEVRDQPLAVYNPSETAFHQAKMVHNWSRDLVLCTDGEAPLTDEQRDQLSRNGITLYEQPLVSVTTVDGRLDQLVFANGQTLPRRALFIRTVTKPSAPFAAELGCAVNDNGIITVDTLGRTNVSGVYAAGDIANPIRSLAIASAQGAAAAFGINFDLVSEDF